MRIWVRGDDGVLRKNHPSALMRALMEWHEERKGSIVVKLDRCFFGDVQTVWALLTIWFGKSPCALDEYPRYKIRRLVAAWDYFMFSDALPFSIPVLKLQDRSIGYAVRNSDRVRLLNRGVRCVQRYVLRLPELVADVTSTVRHHTIHRTRQQWYLFATRTDLGFLVADELEERTVLEKRLGLDHYGEVFQWWWTDKEIVRTVALTHSNELVHCGFRANPFKRVFSKAGRPPSAPLEKVDWTALDWNCYPREHRLYFWDLTT